MATSGVLSSAQLIFVPTYAYGLQEAFSLLAYNNPRASPVGFLLDPQLREPLALELNSAILGEFIGVFQVRAYVVVDVGCSYTM